MVQSIVTPTKIGRVLYSGLCEVPMGQMRQRAGSCYLSYAAKVVFQNQRPDPSEPKRAKQGGRGKVGHCLASEIQFMASMLKLLISETRRNCIGGDG
jgi:hypothetical protein